MWRFELNEQSGLTLTPGVKLKHTVGQKLWLHQSLAPLLIFRRKYSARCNNETTLLFATFWFKFDFYFQIIFHGLYNKNAICHDHPVLANIWDLYKHVVFAFTQLTALEPSHVVPGDREFWPLNGVLGCVRRDISPILKDPAALTAVTDLFEEHVRRSYPQLDLVVGEDLCVPAPWSPFGVRTVSVNKTDCNDRREMIKSLKKLLDSEPLKWVSESLILTCSCVQVWMLGASCSDLCSPSALVSALCWSERKANCPATPCLWPTTWSTAR